MNDTCNGTTVLQITKVNAQAAFIKGSDSDKALISRLFPKEFGDPFTRITSFQDVLSEASVNPARYMVRADMDDEEKHEVYARKMRLIFRVFNDDWKPEYRRGNKQAKYYPWFEITDSGFVLNYVNYFYDDTLVSPRLCARDEKTVRHICKHFLGEYNDYLLS